MPKVSVIIPTYNRAHLVGRAIQSVLDQTYRDFELIIVDDCSTDNTYEVVTGFHDERLRYIRHDKNRGASAARNTGIREARGRYVAFQDSDDEWLPEKLEKQIEVFDTASPEVGVVYTGFWRIQDDKRIYIPSPEIKPKGGDIHDILLQVNLIGTPVTVLKRECFEKVGMFDEELPKLVDWELWIRVSKYYEFSFIDEPLAIAYRTPDSVSEQSNITQALALKSILKKHFEDIKKDRRLLARYYSYIGNLLYTSDDTRAWRNYKVQAFLAYPWNARYMLAALLSLLGQRSYSIVTHISMRMQRRGAREG